MAKTLGGLFFSTAKRFARQQRQAFKIASQAAVSAITKSPVKKKVADKQAVKRGSLRKASIKPVAEAVLAGPGTWQNLIHKVAPTATELLGRLSYSLYRPVIRPVAGMPLVVMLHGCQQTSIEMALGSRMNTLADSKGFVVVYPQQTRRVQALRCWRWFQPDSAHGLAEADAIADLARALVTRHKLDRSRVYVAGMSAGAGMAGLVALRHPDVFAAVAMHSGPVLGDAHSPGAGVKTLRGGSSRDPASLVEPLVSRSRLFPGMPAIILHGQRDHIVAKRNADQLALQFIYLNWAAAGNGLAGSRVLVDRPLPSPRESVLAVGTEREYDRLDYMLGNETVVRVCLVKNVGHAWSGGDARLKFNAKAGPGACRLIWQFFAMHRQG
jgi:poly(hydroxyalkanoate) depolymerase family esterase